MAHISGDESLLRAFTEGIDVHRATAAEVFGSTPDQVSSEQRRYAKVINFGLIYGMPQRHCSGSSCGRSLSGEVGENSSLGSCFQIDGSASGCTYE